MAKPNDDKGFYSPRSGDGLDNHLSNPLPCPDALKKLEKILPGTAERVLSMAERAQRERIEKARWNRFASFFSGIESFILKIFGALSGFVLKIIASILDMFKTLSEEYIRLLVRVLTFILGFVALAVSIFRVLALSSNIHIFFEIVISIVTASAAMLTAMSVYSKVGRRGINSEKKFTVFGAVRALLARLVHLARQASKGGKASSAVGKNKSKRS